MKNGFFEDAAMILRTVFETFITILYCEYDNENYKRFYDYNAISRLDYIEADREILSFYETIDSDKVTELQRKKEEFKKKYNLKRIFNWTDSGVKKICKELDKVYNKKIFESLYITIYKNYSDFIHPNIVNLFENYIKINNGRVKCNIKPCYYEEDCEIISTIEEIGKIFVEVLK